jgi:hypothetical protein
MSLDLDAVRVKLRSLGGSQQSIETLSLYLSVHKWVEMMCLLLDGCVHARTHATHNVSHCSVCVCVCVCRVSCVSGRRSGVFD